MRRLGSVIILGALTCAFALAGCGGGGTAPAETAAPETAAPETEAAEAYAIDYLVLVNKENPLPDTWEDELQTVHLTNTVGNDL